MNAEFDLLFGSTSYLLTDSLTVCQSLGPAETPSTYLIIELVDVVDILAFTWISM